MTVIVGLVCEDGIVVASDSQESDEGMDMKRLDVTKIYDTAHFGFDDAEIVVGGTGSAGLIAGAAEKIREKGFEPHSTPRSVATIVEDVIGDMGERYGVGEDGLDLELLVGVFCNNCSKTKDENSRGSPIGLYSIYPPQEDEKVGVAEPVTDYTAMGTGGLFARYLLNRLHDEDHPTAKLSMDVAIREAIYVIEEVKKVDLWCGGPTQLLCIKRSGNVYVLEKKKPADIKKIADDLASDDMTVKQSQREILLKTNASSQTRNVRQTKTK
jgi:20S proteasome alpha/beta subunit